MQHLPAIGLGDSVGNILAGQHRDRLGGGDLHLLIDLAGTYIKRAAKDVGKAEDIVDLVRIVRAPGGDDRVGPDLLGLFRHDLRHRVGHGENDRAIGHRPYHLRAQRAGHRQAKKHVGPDKGVLQRPRVGRHGMRRLPLVHGVLAALIDHTAAIDQCDIFMRHAHGLDQLDTGD